MWGFPCLLCPHGIFSQEVFQADRQTFPCRPPSFSTCMFHVSLCSVRSHRLCWSPLMHGSSCSLTLQKALQPLLSSPDRWTSLVHGQEPACKFIFIPKLLLAVPSPLRSQTNKCFEPAAVLYRWPGLLTCICIWFLLCFFSKCYCLWPSLSVRIILVLL